MEKLTLELPNMYGDHHVIEVRRILLEIPGVLDVYASSAFKIVEITYDPVKVDAADITQKLDQAGYLGEWIPTTETGIATPKNGKEGIYRHTMVYEQTRGVVSFAQNTAIIGRPLWPCPGMGTISGALYPQDMDEE